MFPKSPKIHQPTEFNWQVVPLEFFRGDDLTFPVKIELIIAPSFDLVILNALNAFHKQVAGHPVLDRENDGFNTRISEYAPVLDDEDPVKLQGDELGFHMTYINGDQRFSTLAFIAPEKLITYH